MAKLGDLCNIQSGGTPARSERDYWENGQIPWVKISDIRAKFLNNTEEHITELGLKNSSAKVFPSGTILYTIFATLGETCILNIDAATNQAIAGIQIERNDLIRDYLYYYLLSRKDAVLAMGRGVAQNNINLKMLRDFEISIPPLDEQRRIAAVLDKVSGLIAKRREQLDKLDELVKARFVEMFGYPIKNEKGFPTITGQDFFKLSNGKFVPENKRFDNGVPAYGGNGISWYTDEILYHNDTIVVGRVGFQSGNVHLAKGPLWITDNAMYISDYDSDKYDLRFLYALMEHINFTRFQDAGDLKKITQKPFMSMEYITPTLKQQQEYVVFVEQTEKSKLTIQQSLDKLEVLKKALIQQYFET